jgi:hypothetical protein
MDESLDAHEGLVIILDHAIDFHLVEGKHA